MASLVTAPGPDMPKPRGRRKKIRTEPVRPICPQCEKQFSNQSALTKHKLTHSDERRFACQQCSKAFKRHDHLTGHMQTHSNRKPFNCNIGTCDKTYCDARSLRRHKENIHHIVAPRENGLDGRNHHNNSHNHQHNQQQPFNQHQNGANPTNVKAFGSVSSATSSTESINDTDSVSGNQLNNVHYDQQFHNRNHYTDQTRSNHHLNGVTNYVTSPPNSATTPGSCSVGGQASVNHLNSGYITPASASHTPTHPNHTLHHHNGYGSHGPPPLSAPPVPSYGGNHDNHYYNMHHQHYQQPPPHPNQGPIIHPPSYAGAPNQQSYLYQRRLQRLHSDPGKPIEEHQQSPSLQPQESTTTATTSTDTQEVKNEVQSSWIPVDEANHSVQHTPQLVNHAGSLSADYTTSSQQQFTFSPDQIGNTTDLGHNTGMMYDSYSINGLHGPPPLSAPPVASYAGNHDNHYYNMHHQHYQQPPPHPNQGPIIHPPSYAGAPNQQSYLYQRRLQRLHSDPGKPIEEHQQHHQQAPSLQPREPATITSTTATSSTSSQEVKNEVESSWLPVDEANHSVQHTPQLVAPGSADYSTGSQQQFTFSPDQINNNMDQSHSTSYESYPMHSLHGPPPLSAPLVPSMASDHQQQQFQQQHYQQVQN